MVLSLVDKFTSLFIDVKINLCHIVSRKHHAVSCTNCISPIHDASKVRTSYNLNIGIKKKLPFRK